jgi:hypothetical protein
MCDRNEGYTKKKNMNEYDENFSVYIGLISKHFDKNINQKSGRNIIDSLKSNKTKTHNYSHNGIQNCLNNYPFIEENRNFIINELMIDTQINFN